MNRYILKNTNLVVVKKQTEIQVLGTSHLGKF